MATTKRKKKPAAKKRAAKKPTSARRKTRKQPESLRLRTVAPSLTVNSLDRSIAFYRDLLGFVQSDQWEMNGRVAGVELVAGSVRLMLMQDDFAKGRDRAKGIGTRLNLRTKQSVDTIAARITSKGGTLTYPPRDMEWGERAFSVDDPDGFHLTVLQER